MMKSNTDHLAGAARAFGLLHTDILTTYALIRRGDLATAETYAEQAMDKANTVTARLQAAGAPPAAFDSDRPVAPTRTGSLGELALLDTPDARALLDGVRALLPLAEKVDRARGRYSDAPPGQPTGDDTAETLYMLACRLGLEVDGPKGRE